MPSDGPSPPPLLAAAEEEDFEGGLEIDEDWATEDVESPENYSLWHTNTGHTLLRTAIGAGLAAFFGALIWAIRTWRLEQLEREYWEAARPQEHSLSRVLRKKKGGGAKEGDDEPPPRPPTPIQWLIGRGLDGLAREIERAKLVRKRCDPCRYAASGGPIACPHAFACGALRHPRASVAYAMVRGLAWFGFSMLIVAVIALVLGMMPARPNSRPLGEALWFAAPGLLALAGFVSGIVFVWTLWSALVIRRQVRETAKAADELGLEFLNFRKLTLETGALAFPLLHPGEVTEVHVALHGRLKGQPLVVAYYEYEMSERDGPGSDWERKAAVARGAMGKETHESWGQLVIMFPEPLVGVPDFQISPPKDIDYYLCRVSRPIEGFLHHPELQQLYCATSRDPRAHRLFNESLRKFLIDNPEWNVQCIQGRLMLWHGTYDVLAAEIAPRKKERLIADLETALRWRNQLAARGQESGAN